MNKIEITDKTTKREFSNWLKEHIYPSLYKSERDEEDESENVRFSKDLWKFAKTIRGCTFEQIGDLDKDIVGKIIITIPTVMD